MIQFRLHGVRFYALVFSFPSWVFVFWDGVFYPFFLSFVGDNVSLSEPSRRRLFRKGEGDERRPANAPLLSVNASRVQLSPYALARRCDSRSRGSVYDPVLGICCHFCRFGFSILI